MCSAEPARTRYSWQYANGIPVITASFVTFDSCEIRNLQVDTGFSGWFLIDWNTYQRLGLERAELPEEFWPIAKGFGGKRRLRGGYITVTIPQMDFVQVALVYSAPGLDNEWNLVGLRFLDQFVWSGNGERFSLQTRETSGF